MAKSGANTQQGLDIIDSRGTRINRFTGSASRGATKVGPSVGPLTSGQAVANSDFSREQKSSAFADLMRQKAEAVNAEANRMRKPPVANATPRPSAPRPSTPTAPSTFKTLDERRARQRGPQR